MTCVLNESSVGLAPVPIGNQMGRFVISAPSSDSLAAMPVSDYVAGTYANFPEATALVPTTTLNSNGVTPLFGLYT